MTARGNSFAARVARNGWRVVPDGIEVMPGVVVAWRQGRLGATLAAAWSVVEWRREMERAVRDGRPLRRSGAAWKRKGVKGHG